MRMSCIIPMLPIKNIQNSIEFYQRLGFTIEEKNNDWDWAMLSFGECRLMLDKSIYEHRDIPSQSVLYFYPENIEEYHKEIQRNGVSVPDLKVTFYGMTEFRLEDPDGNRLWIGQNIPRS